MKKINKSGQEEMIGFAVIIIVVAVILVVFLWFSIRETHEENIESYESESFIQAFLQYTSDCKENYETDYLSVQKLIVSCKNSENCFDGRETCKVLENSLKEIAEISWKVGEETPVKGYELKINSENSEIVLIKEGNSTNDYRGAMQDFSDKGNLIEVLFNVYY